MRATLPKMVFAAFPRRTVADGRKDGRWRTDRPCAVLRIIAVPKEDERNAKEGRNVPAGGNFDHLRKEEGSREIATLQ